MPDGNTLVMTRVLPASAKRVFDAWTNPDLIKQWFAPGEKMTTPVAEVDLREGGDYLIVMEDDEGGKHSPSGRYETVIPNEKLVFTWKWAHMEMVTRVTIDLRQLGDNETELTLTHEGFPDEELRDRHNEGWSGVLGRLDSFINQ